MSHDTGHMASGEESEINFAYEDDAHVRSTRGENKMSCDKDSIPVSKVKAKMKDWNVMCTEP